MSERKEIYNISESAPHDGEVQTLRFASAEDFAPHLIGEVRGERETLAGRIVLSIGIDTKSDTDLLLAGELTQVDKDRLDELHLRKIDLADIVYILNVGGYIGESTRREIAYACQHGKVIRWLEPEAGKYFSRTNDDL